MVGKPIGKKNRLKRRNKANFYIVLWTGYLQSDNRGIDETSEWEISIAEQ